MLDRIKWMNSEMIVGGLVTLLSAIAAISGFQNANADSEQTRHNVEAQKLLTNANADYLSANQLIGYDTTLYDNWVNADDPEKVEYYRDLFSPELEQVVSTNPDADPFTEAYYTAMYRNAEAVFDEADAQFDMAEEFGDQSDALQVVMLISAFGLSITAWSALVKPDSPLRIIFVLVGLALLIYCCFLLATVPQAG